MIQTQFKQLQEWIDNKSLKERIFILLMGCFVIYTLWILLFGSGSSSEQKRLAGEIRSIQKKMSDIQTQSDNILGAVTNNAFFKTLESGKKISTQSHQLQQELQKKGPFFMAETDLVKLNRDILLEQKNIVLANVKTFPEERWVPSADVDPALLPVSLKKIYKRAFQIQFKNNYVNTMNYLARLEKLPWHIYWDALEYKVDNYPDALVVVKFYVLSVK